MQARRRCMVFHTRWLFALAAFAVSLSTLTGCGDDRGGRANEAPSRDSERVPMLPGTGQASPIIEPSKPVTAERFGSNGNAGAAPASGALLPPVMHSAD